MSSMPEDPQPVEHRRLLIDLTIEIDDPIALATATFARLLDPDTGEESMIVHNRLDDTLASYLLQAVNNAMEIVANRGGFTAHPANVRIEHLDETGNYPIQTSTPLPGPGKSWEDVSDAYPDVWPRS